MSRQVLDFCQQLFAHLGVSDAECTAQEDDDHVFVQCTVSEQESGMLIGYHGETIASLQRVVSHAFKKLIPDKKIVMNVNDYKEKREEVVQNMAMRFAQKVVETGQQHVLPYLPANERLIIHTTIKNVTGVKSFSQGEGIYRRLIIAPISE